VDYDASNILVTLSLLGTTLIKGDVPAPAKQVQLNVAVSKLTAAINSGSLIVPVDVDKLTDVSWQRHCRDHMVVGFTTTYVISAYHH
jgi:hypothetical protein